MRETVLVVEDDKIARAVLKRWLTAANFEVVACRGVAGTLEQVGETQPAAVCIDLGLPDGDGLTLATQIMRAHPSIPVIIVTGDASAETAVRTLQAGAVDYLVKPLERVRLLERLHGVLAARPFAREWADSSAAPAEGDVPGMVGDSDVSRLVRQQVRLVAAGGIDVLIEGATGTGKELVARGIHALGPTASGRFVAVNCAALSDSLIDSELFGHERHAFTGADRRHVGRIEQAHGGTLFLDEVAELSLVAQAKLLRVLQERRIHRVGGTTEVEVDFRLITATNRSLESLVQAGRFRPDLLFRIAVYKIELLPLCERRGDILPLVDAFLTAHPRRSDGCVPRLSHADRATLRAAQWAGNVRELHNVLRRAIVHMDRDGWISVGPLSPTHAPAGPEKAASAEPGSLAEAERVALLAAVRWYGSDVSEMAKRLGVGRSTLYRKLAEHGLRISRDLSDD